MKTKDGLTQADIDSYDVVALELMILLDPFTADEVRRCDYLCDRIWETVVISRRERAQSGRMDPA